MDSAQNFSPNSTPPEKIPPQLPPDANPIDSLNTGASKEIVSKERQALSELPAAVLKGVEIKTLSPAEEKWLNKKAAQIVKEHNLDLIIAKVLAARSLAGEGSFTAGKKLERYLAPSLERDLPNKWRLKNLDSACNLIVKAIESGKKIALCYDYDVDGSSAMAQLATVLRKVGAKFDFYSPDRVRDGYGLKDRLVERVVADKADLVIALDFGTTNHKQVADLKAKGIKTIVVDHHEIVGTDTNPPADAFINPHQKGCGFAKELLCTAGLAFFVSMGIREKLLQSDNKDLITKAEKIDRRALLAYAALGTIADVVPLKDVNRVITKEGLKVMTESNEPWIKAFKAVCGLVGEIRSEDIGFAIAPRINAAGRMVREEEVGKSGARLVGECLTAKGLTTAMELASKLNEYNIERKKVEQKMMKVAFDLVREEMRQNGGKLPAALVLRDDSFHEGVAGIIAARMVDRFNRPTVVLSPGEGGVYKMSARGIKVKAVHIAQAFEELGHLLNGFGGHEGAGGGSVSQANADQFKVEFIKLCEKKLQGIDITPREKATIGVTLEELKAHGHRFEEESKKLEPFGQNNPAPSLVVRNVQVVSAVLDKNGRHIDAMLRQGDTYLKAHLWHQPDHPALKPGNMINIICTPQSDSRQRFSDKNIIQLKVIAAEECKTPLPEVSELLDPT